MRLKRTRLAFVGALLLGVLAPAQTFTTLYNFTGGLRGGGPFAGVIQDDAGNLYGTTALGGPGSGVVYKLSSGGAETALFAFSGSQGESPTTPLVRDEAGSLYGTTQLGGESGDYGTVFKLDSAGNETVLHSFTGGSDGCYPMQGLARDQSGASYGTTSGCGAHGAGTIFKIDSAGNFTLLHGFASGKSDGANPEYGHLMLDASGNLYGVTGEGGSTECSGYGCGVLYEFSRSGTETLLHRFQGGSPDGCFPDGSVVQDGAGNLYGTTAGCGSDNHGTVWKVSKKGKETILHNFAGGTSDGCLPRGGVARDSRGSLYGATNECGAVNYGALYKLSASGTLTLLHSFDHKHGAYPYDDVLLTNQGTLYGTTSEGGNHNSGTVWQYAP